MRYLLLVVFGSLSLATSGQSAKSTIGLKKDSINSSRDGVNQHIYYFKSIDKNPQPLVVQLHSWSFPADSLRTGGLDREVADRNFNYIFPDFRGVNNHIKACCSDYVISDIDEAIDWAMKNMKVDKSRIYVVGVSGGGYATLAMYMKSRHNIKAFSAWVPLTDLEKWYAESTERKNKYAPEIISCTSENGLFDAAKARERSPIYWTTPVRKRKNSILQIFAGIHDGYNGPIPISHSVNFYNKILGDNRISDSTSYVSRKDLSQMVTHQTFSPTTQVNIADRPILYQKRAKLIALTIFEGGHEMLTHEVLNYIDQVRSR